MVERANSVPSSRNSRKIVPVNASRTVAAGRRLSAPLTSQPRPVAPSSKIADRPRAYDTSASSPRQVGVVSLDSIVKPEKPRGGR